MPEYNIHLRRPYEKQQGFVDSTAKRKIIRAGRRSGKTTGISVYAAKKFMEHRRVLYATPTSDQLGKFWFEITKALAEPIAAGVLYKNETEHVIELPGTEERIRAKTAWNSDTLRGDYCDVLIFDEWQLMNEDAWGLVGAPMLLDNDGDAVFIYTPPSLRTRSTTKAQDPLHAAKLYKRAQADKTGRWAVFHFTSHDNPYISKTALVDITQDMTNFAYRQEILAEDIEDNPGALWRREWIESNRTNDPPDLARIIVAVDPSGGVRGDEIGITVQGSAKIDGLWHFYLLEDLSLHGTPKQWANAAVAAYYKWDADAIVAEANFGGDMVKNTIKTVEGGDKAKVKLVTASRGKAIRAEPLSAVYEQGRGHHVGTFSILEDELCQWEPGMPSPNRMDALVWGGTELVLGRRGGGGARGT